MEEYAEELRSPPVALVALVGCPEHHVTISTHLNDSEQPPINTLALPDFSKISVLAKPPSASSSSPPPPSLSSPPSSSPSVPGGILKRDWLLKHRTRVPAVVAALFASHQVSRDPSQWLEISSHLDNLKAVIRGRNIKLVVVVVQSTSNDDMSDDRMQALRKHAEVDPKCFIGYFPDEDSDLKQSLKRIGSTFAELANTYYRDEGRRIKSRIERKGVSSIDLLTRYCFKVAVYAEFRRDWAEALRFYEDAYNALREASSSSTKMPAIQRLVEIKIVAEQMHFKISTLLLHGGKVTEAIAWFRQHIASYKKIAGPPQVLFLHWEWMSRQFLAFAELLETSSATIESILPTAISAAGRQLTDWEFLPAYYYQLAAHYLKEKRSCLELALTMAESINEIDVSAESVVPSFYVGQYARLLEQGDSYAMQPLGDEEYISFSLAEGKRFLDSFEIIALLKKSFESYSNLKVQRMACHCGFQMAREYFVVGDYNNAQKFFDRVASLYRQEGWVTMMWDVLGYLRECSRQQGLVKDFVEYSLEMAALPVSSVDGSQSSSSKDWGPAGPACLSRRKLIHIEAFKLVRGELELESIVGGDGPKLKVIGDCPLHLEIDLVSPLRVVLLASVAFHEQVVKPGASTLITLSLLSQLPHTVEIDQLEIQFNQAHCNFTVSNAQRSLSVAVSNEKQSHRVESAPVLSLISNKWLRLTFEIKTEQVGKLECVSAVARIGHYFTVCCRAESPASMDGLPLWKFEDRVEIFPTKDPALSFSGQKAIQVEEPDPQVDLNLCATGPALVGESFIILVNVVSKGHAVHSGELKINLVDPRAVGMVSPREFEPDSMENPHVELLSLAGSHESEKSFDGIKKIQQTYGLVSLPFFNNGDSWSCKLEMKWHRPKPVTLYVSLGYSPYGNGTNVQKVHVHKSLQIEGKTAVVIGHSFMLPFRRDALLLSRIRASPNSDKLASLPLNEPSVVVVSAKNCTEVPLELLSMSIEADCGGNGGSCTVQQGNEAPNDLGFLPPGEEFKKIFSIIPELNIPVVQMGTVILRWRRHSGPGGGSVVTKHRLPDANAELSPLIVSLDCPPHAVLGDPFTYLVRIQNQTQLLQEVKFSLADSQSFLLSGPHNDTINVLPRSDHILSYKLVPLSSGSVPLPRVTFTSTRYSAAFIPSHAAATVFVFPTERNC